MAEPLYVTMLGSFSIRKGEKSVGEHSNRMKKVWLLLAYLIYFRNGHTTQENYLSLLRGSGSEESADPGGRLKAMFYRARTMLDELGEAAGHELIVRRDGTYVWNNQIPLVLDVEEFERLCRQGAGASEDEARLDLYRQALELYQGDFLPKLAMEPWVMPVTAYYHRLYLDVAEQTLALLERRELWAEGEALCRKALKLEPYSEELYQSLMRCRLGTGDRAGVLSAYEEMSELLFATFGVMPSDESRKIYRQASKEEGSPVVPVGELRDILREPAGAKGALVCEYDFFKLLYQVQARAIIRSGEIIHIVLFSLHPQRGKELSRRSLDCAMDNFQQLMAGNLRQGDVISRCSVSQLMVMLPQANYENSCMVCQRILKAFARQYPHSPVEIHYSVQPLEPRELSGAAPNN